MRFSEITNEDKVDFKNKLKYPMELVDGITKEVERVNAGFDEDWIKVDYDQEFGDDFVAWTIELTYNPTEGRTSVIGDMIEQVYQASVRNYQWEDIPLTYQILNREEDVDGGGYLLMGIQLDV